MLTNEQTNERTNATDKLDADDDESLFGRYLSYRLQALSQNSPFHFYLSNTAFLES